MCEAKRQNDFYAKLNSVVRPTFLHNKFKRTDVRWIHIYKLNLNRLRCALVQLLSQVAVYVQVCELRIIH